MLVVFPSDPIHPKSPNPDFALEYEAAKKVGCKVGLYNFDLHLGSDVTLTVPKTIDIAVYRGWILKAEEYRKLYLALAMRGCGLINSPDKYTFTSFFPNWCSELSWKSDITPKSIWFPGSNPDIDHICDRLSEQFQDRPLILKDYIKSQKHYWFDACFIPSASSRADVERVTTNFLRLQGDFLEGGLVYREFLDFKRTGIHPKSQMPLIHEFRFFVAQGVILGCYPYWADGTYNGPTPPYSIIQNIKDKMSSSFYTVDVAQLENNEWMVIEVGDGGASGLPEGSDIPGFYRNLHSVSMF